MDTLRVAVGVFALAVGAVGARYARVLAKHEEQLDAIGSQRSATEVESAAWKVSLVFLQMVLFVVFGLYLLVTAAL